MEWPAKKHVLLFLILANASQAWAQSIEERSEPLDFATVVERVRAASAALARGQLQREAAEAGRTATQLQDAPTVQMNSSVGWQYSSSSFKQQHTVQLTTALWDFGRQAAQELRAELQVKSAQASELEFDENLRFRTARYFISLASAEGVLALASEQSRNAENKLQAVISAYKRGERPQTDVVKLRVEFGRAQLLALRAKDEFNALAAQLQLLMQRESSAQETIRTLRIKPLKERSSEQWTALLTTWAALSPESAAQEKWNVAEQLIRAELNALEAEKFPQLGASAGVQVGGNLVPIKPDLFAQLNFQYSLPLSASRDFRRSAVLARIKEQQTAASEERKTRLDKLIQARLRVEGLAQTIALQKTQIETLLEYQKLIRARYFAGRATLLELTTTEDDLLANRLELTRQQANLYTTALDAAEALGGKQLELLF